jgi:hypothetical protein
MEAIYLGSFLIGLGLLVVTALMGGEGEVVLSKDVGDTFALQAIPYALMLAGAFGYFVHPNPLAAGAVGGFGGLLVHKVFRVLRSTEAGVREREDSYVGRAAVVGVTMTRERPGRIAIDTLEGRVEMQAYVAADSEEVEFAQGREVRIHEYKAGVAYVRAN